MLFTEVKFSFINNILKIRMFSTCMENYATSFAHIYSFFHSEFFFHTCWKMSWSSRCFHEKYLPVLI